jgi:Ca-activated chloride channel family protein
MSFAEPLFLVLTLLVVPMLWLRRKRQAAVGHSQAGQYRNLRSVPIVGWLPAVLFTLAWTAMCVALARPMLPHVNEKQSIQTRDVIITTDISASMWTQLSDPAQQQLANSGQQAGGDASGQPPRQPMRIDAAVQAIKLFVARRQGDRVALFVFDTDTYYHWPLTADLKIILDKADLISKTMGGGTNFEGPSDGNPGMGPLQAAINHFKQYGKAKTKVLIMVTDGEDSISAKRMDELQAQMQAAGIRLYVLGVGDSWTNGSQPDLKTFVERMGGVVIPVGDAAQMRAGMDKIDQLEKSTVSLEKQVSYKDIYQVFLGAGIVLWLLYLASAAFIRESA